jgi:hypothetical protein
MNLPGPGPLRANNAGIEITLSEADLAWLYAWSQTAATRDILHTARLRAWIQDCPRPEDGGPFEGRIPTDLAQVAAEVCRDEIEHGSDLALVRPARDLLRRLTDRPV